LILSSLPSLRIQSPPPGGFKSSSFPFFFFFFFLIFFFLGPCLVGTPATFFRPPLLIFPDLGSLTLQALAVFFQLFQGFFRLFSSNSVWGQPFAVPPPVSASLTFFSFKRLSFSFFPCFFDESSQPIADNKLLPLRRDNPPHNQNKQKNNPQKHQNPTKKQNGPDCGTVFFSASIFFFFSPNHRRSIFDPHSCLEGLFPPRFFPLRQRSSPFSGPPSVDRSACGPECPVFSCKVAPNFSFGTLPLPFGFSLAFFPLFQTPPKFF